ncbi:MAG TPA: CpsB/CapC family capsule biosynthesis tyrosine phosphatase [bacterium]|nr:CpsB/CapC family capsule biosynthesis tyrosine phosphatase [bacterium]
MIDMHSHILPGLDDGARTIEQSVEMARELMLNGFEGVVATPHIYEKDGGRLAPAAIEETLHAFQSRLQSEGISLTVYGGAEYLLDRPLPELVRRCHPLATLAGGLYMLIELPVMQWPNYLEYSVMPLEQDPPELRHVLPFLRPVIAHPERSQEVMRDHHRLSGLRDLGYMFQVNLESILGLTGRHAAKVIKKMAKDGLIDLVGTDGHSLEGLKKLLPDWRRHAEKVIGRERAELVLDENPRRVVNNQAIDLD